MHETSAHSDPTFWNSPATHGPSTGSRLAADIDTNAVTPRQRGSAVAVALLLALVGIVATPFATTPLIPIPGYMTGFGSAMIVINLLLAVLLFSKGAIEGGGGATRLGVAYLYVAIIFIPLVASFPGGIMPGSVIGTAISSVWLWSFWHAGFGLLIIRYAYLSARPNRSEPLGVAIIAVFALVAVATVVSTRFLSYLPSTLSDGHRLFSGASGFLPIGILIIQAIGFALVCKLRARTPEELWLAVATAAALFDVWLTYWGSERFSLGWYLSKCGSAFTSLALLITLLHEVTILRVRASAANTELARARDEAERANRAKSQFLASMSHELRTPLNGILGYAELLHSEGSLSRLQTSRLDAMRGAGTHLLEMINCVLDLSQIEANRLELRPTEFDALAVATAALDLMRPLAEAKGLRLSIAVAPGTPRMLFADPTRLRQIMLNLVGNATKFTTNGAVELRLMLVADGSALRFEVVDTGPGISAEQSLRLFQDFERIDTAATASVEGSGLGLALSSRLVTLMNGRLGHEANPGGGSVFWLELPVPAGSAQSTEVSSDGAVGQSASAPKAAYRVLVVDDMAMNGDIACAFLRMAGHAAVSAEDGVTAVELAKTSDFDVVFMDVRMPGMDGLEATRRIRDLTGPRGRVPIIALTAQVFTEHFEECRQAGMDSHVGKPFTQETLLAALSLAMASCVDTRELETAIQGGQ